jgi:hypothetical protein
MKITIQSIIIYFLLFVIIYNLYNYVFNRPGFYGLIEGLENKKKSNSKTRELQLDDDLENDENMVKIITEKEEKEEKKEQKETDTSNNNDIKQQMKDQLKNEVKVEDMEKRLAKLEEALKNEKEDRVTKEQNEKAMADVKSQLSDLE